MSYQTEEQRINNSKIRKMVYDILKEQGMLKSYEKFPDIVKRSNPMDYYNQFEQVPLDKRDETYRKRLFEILREQADLKKKKGFGMCEDKEFDDNDEFKEEYKCYMMNGGKKKKSKKDKGDLIKKMLKRRNLNSNTMTKTQMKKLIKDLTNKDKTMGYGKYMDNKLYREQDIDDYLRKQAFEALKRKDKKRNGGVMASKKNKWIMFLKVYQKQNPNIVGKEMMKKAKVVYNDLKRQNKI